MTYELDAKKSLIGGLSAEDIGKWIKQVRGMSLLMIPDLQTITKNSAGLPLLLDEWIRSSKDLKDYDNIKRDKLCTQIIGTEGLEDELDQAKLDKMCILLYPLKFERLTTYLGKVDNNVDLVTAFVKRLSKNRIFDEESEWFRHELVKKCLEDRLGDERKRRYHEGAAKFFESLVEEKQINENTLIEDGEAEEKYSIAMSYAYHLHNAGGGYHEKSFRYNKALAEYASQSGDLDVADAQFLKRIKDEMDCFYAMTSEVFVIWGRNDEALCKYESLLRYYQYVNDSLTLAAVLNSIAAIQVGWESLARLFSSTIKAWR
jgi:hypothetical protein